MTVCAATFPKRVPKVWGEEVWLVNEPEYCCKMLYLNKGASGSLHYHLVKKETFIVGVGKVELEIAGKRAKLTAGPGAITILPGQPHRFKALKQSVIIEVSTHHEDKDVVRLEESRA
mgnify:CR=1 FL=1